MRENDRERDDMALNLDKLTPEQIQNAMACKSLEDFQAFIKDQGLDLAEDEAQASTAMAKSYSGSRHKIRQSTCSFAQSGLQYVYVVGCLSAPNERRRVMKNKFLVSLMACVLAFGMFALAGCGGSSSSQSGPTDEELITADAEGIIAKILTPDNIESMLSKTSGGTIEQMESMGLKLDYEALAASFKDVIKLKVDSVTVNGDTATAAITTTYPDYTNEEASKIMEAEMTKVFGEADLASLATDTDKLSDLMNDAITTCLTSPDLPTTSASGTIDYEKVNGTWQIKDDDALNKLLASSGLS